MKNLSHYLPVALMTLLLLLLLVGSACDEKSSIVESVGTPAPDPPFELDPAAEPPIKTSKFVVLSHSRYLFYNLAKEIRGYYNAALLHINDNTTAEITAKLKRIQPEYAIVVLPPHQIKPDVVANLFLSFCSLDDDVDLDLGYGYITGCTLEDARNLFYRTKNDTVEVGSFLGVSHVFPGDGCCRPTVSNYAKDFEKSSWKADTAIIDSKAGQPSKQLELRKFEKHRMVFFIGHGSYDNSCDIAASDLSNIDLTGDIILSGACYTGATSSDREPWDFIALKILNRGADIYVSNVIVNGWVNMMFIAKLLCLNQMSMGQVVMAGINQQMSWGGITGNITQLEIVPANKLDCTQCASATSAKCIINGIARIIPFGDPSYKPKLKSTVVLSFP